MINPYGEIGSSFQSSDQRRLLPWLRPGKTGEFIPGVDVEWDPIGPLPVVGCRSPGTGVDVVMVYNSPNSGMGSAYSRAVIETAGLGDFDAGYRRLIDDTTRWVQGGMRKELNRPVPPILETARTLRDLSPGAAISYLAYGQDGSGLMPELGM